MKNHLDRFTVGLTLSIACWSADVASAGDLELDKLTCKAGKPFVVQSGPGASMLEYRGAGGHFIVAQVPGAGLRVQLLDNKRGTVKATKLVNAPSARAPSIGSGGDLLWLDGKTDSAPDELWTVTLDVTKGKLEEQAAPRKIYTFAADERPADGQAWLLVDLGMSTPRVVWVDTKGNLRMVQPSTDKEGKQSQSFVLGQWGATSSRPLMNGMPDEATIAWLAHGKDGTSDLMVISVRLDFGKPPKFAPAVKVATVATPADRQAPPGSKSEFIVQEGSDVLYGHLAKLKRDEKLMQTGEKLTLPAGTPPTSWAIHGGALVMANDQGLWFGWQGSAAAPFRVIAGTKGKQVSDVNVIATAPQAVFVIWHESDAKTEATRAVHISCK